MSSLEKIKDKATKIAFDKKVVSETQHLQGYVKHRIYIAESTGVIPRNMYTSTGIIDESIVKFYDQGYDIDMTPEAIKLKLFKIVDDYLNELFKKEAFHKDTVSTTDISKNEFEDFEDKYTLDGDLDYVMDEDLDDISYHQEDFDKQLFSYDENTTMLLDAFETDNVPATVSQKAVGHMYSWLPLRVSNIIDLYVFGKLNFKEISKVKNIEFKRVERIFEAVKKNFRKNLD